MAPRAEMPSGAPGSNMGKRLLSAAVLLPLAFGALWFGGVCWASLVGLFGVAMAWEWSKICGRAPGEAAGPIEPAEAAAILAVAIAVAMAALERYVPALGLLAVGATAAASVGAVSGGRRGRWHGLGVFYVGLPCIAILWIRAQHGDGLSTLAWMLSLVVAVDTGAFAAGRLIGGPKLAPRISPKKTWAGLAGGIGAAMLVGWVAAIWLGLSQRLLLIGLSGALAVVEQAGDLAESAFKRRFAVKDSSQLIPGHGGVLDRVDGLLAVSMAVAITEYFSGGIISWTR
jgi:phosphatidate cytidylyltransferase